MILNRQFGDYILLQRLAIGGQSEVFLALKSGPRDFTRPVVIKALPSSARSDERLVEMFYREAFISSRFSHPNVINVHDARVIEDDHCMLMDFVNGQTVADIAQRGYRQKAPPTLKQIVRIIADAADGLAYVHDFKALDNVSYSVVHLDVSPQNIMVTYQGVGMIFDFGIAKIIGLEKKQPRLGGGKYAYMSPEQVEGKGVDPRSDIFSLGVILYELCTGYRLFRRNTPQEVVRAILEEPIRPPRELRPSIPEQLQRIILRALERDPFARYQSAQSLRDDLVEYLSMNADVGDLRRGLGAYVGSMFKQERADIAAALQAAPETVDEAEPLDTSLTKLGAAGRNKEPTMELLIPGGAQDAGAVPKDGTDSEPSAYRARELEEELHRMRRRQTTLYAAIGLLALLALLLGFASLVKGSPSHAQEPPVVRR